MAESEVHRNEVICRLDPFLGWLLPKDGFPGKEREEDDVDVAQTTSFSELVAGHLLVLNPCLKKRLDKSKDVESLSSQFTADFFSFYFSPYSASWRRLHGFKTKRAMVAYEFEFERGKCENARVGNEVAVNKFFSSSVRLFTNR